MSSNEKHTLLRAMEVYKNQIRGNISQLFRSGSKVKSNAKESAMKILINSPFDLGPVVKFMKDVEESLKMSGHCYISLSFRTTASIIAGWSPIYFITEVPTAWDMILNVPYIMGSTIKGIVLDSFRSIYMGSAELERCIFGDKSSAGSFVFFDAYPVGVIDQQGSQVNLLSTDLINPHYKGVRTEYDVNPVPIKYVAVKKGVLFRVFIAYRAEDAKRCSGNVMQELMKALLFSAKRGWGRRSTRGYGRMKVEGQEVVVNCPS